LFVDFGLFFPELVTFSQQWIANAATQDPS